MYMMLRKTKTVAYAEVIGPIGLMFMKLKIVLLYLGYQYLDLCTWHGKF